MPEGPEVTTIVTGLHVVLKDAQIRAVTFAVDPCTVIEGASPDEFRGRVVGQRIEDVTRRGKFIDIKLATGDHLVFHLRMTGQLIYQQQGTDCAPPRFLRAVFQFANGAKLCLADKSTWVRCALLSQVQWDAYPPFARLGTDMLGDGLSLGDFKKRLALRRAIHSVLLDQTIFSGLGNIYVNEVLHYAGVHPARRAITLSDDEATVLYFAIRHVLREAIRHKGTTFSDYRTADGGRGTYQRFLRVFRRRGAPCLRCGTAIERMRVGGRSAFYCPRDQPQEQGVKEIGRQLTLPDAPWPVGAASATNHLFALCGLPSSGKTTLARELPLRIPFLRWIRPLTTRPVRSTDAAGTTDAICMSAADFDRERHRLIACAENFGHWYGIPRDEIDAALREGDDVLVIMSAGGVSGLKKAYPSAHVLLVVPPSRSEWQKRVQSRRDYRESERGVRLQAEDGEFEADVASDGRIVTLSSASAFEQACGAIYRLRCKTE